MGTAADNVPPATPPPQSTAPSSRPPRARKQKPVKLAPKPAARRYRQTITKIDLWSVTKLSLCFYLCGMLVTLVALVALWLIADVLGVVGNIEKFLGDLFDVKNFTFLSTEMLRGALISGLVIVALLVILTVIAGSFYNMFAELFGGLEVTVKEEEPRRS
jgi:hypothetical protein